MTGRLIGAVVMLAVLPLPVGILAAALLLRGLDCG